MAKEKNPVCEWEQAPGETVRQYEKFCAYRDMRYILPGPGAGAVPKLDITAKRSIRGLAKKLGISHKSLEPLSVRFHWIERCDAYDAYILERMRKKSEADIIRMRETHAAIASQMLRKATARLLTLGDHEIEAADVVRLVDVGVKIERLSRGVSTEHREVSGEAKFHHDGEVAVKQQDSIDLSSLSDEELERFEELVAKLHPEPGV